MNIHSITLKDYADTVATLVTLAQDSTGGSKDCCPGRSECI